MANDERRLITAEERALARRVWSTVMLPIGSEERRLVAYLMTDHPRWRATDEQIARLVEIAMTADHA